MWNIGTRRGTVRAHAIAAILIAALGGSSGALSADDPANEPVKRNPITIYTENARAGASGALVEQLMQRAEAQGEIRVIVGLRMTMRMESTLTPAQAVTQLRALQSVQSGVAARVLGAAAAQSEDRFTFIPYMSMFVNAAELSRLLADPQVASVQEDLPSWPMLAQSAPLTHAPEVWTEDVNGTNQVIAVLDTGVAKKHPMFAGKVVSEACYSTTNAADESVSLCPRGVAASTAARSGLNCPASLRGCDHGTHVAGIAAGNSSTLDGIARSAKLIAIKVFSRFTEPNPDKVGSWDTDVIKGLQRVYALRNSYKIAAVNMSIGGDDEYAEACDDFYPAMAAAITQLRDAGIGSVVAAGNDGVNGAISKPACISTAIAVGNTRKDDVLDVSSNHSDLVRLLAPGTAIRSAVLGNQYGRKTGTSMATPHVAGAFALLRQAKPTATIDEIVEALRCSGKPVDRVQDKDGIVELVPYRRRIDLLGAFYTIRNVPNYLRTWSFSSAAEGLDWAALHGKWAVQSGNYVPTPPRRDGVAAQAETCHTNVRVIARVQRQETANSGYLETGVVVRAQSSFTEDYTSGYAAVYVSCRTNSTGHCDEDGTGPLGLALFYRINQQKASQGFPARFTLCRKGVAVNVGGYNTVKVVSNGATHSYYLNGNLVCTANDNTYDNGNVLLFGGPANLATKGLKFDSVSIQAIGRNAPASALSLSSR